MGKGLKFLDFLGKTLLLIACIRTSKGDSKGGPKGKLKRLIQNPSFSTLRTQEGLQGHNQKYSFHRFSAKGIMY